MKPKFTVTLDVVLALRVAVTVETEPASEMERGLADRETVGVVSPVSTIVTVTS